MDKRLADHYTRQLRKSGFHGNPGGWVFYTFPSGAVARWHGWWAVRRALAQSLERHVLALVEAKEKISGDLLTDSRTDDSISA